MPNNERRECNGTLPTSNRAAQHDARSECSQARLPFVTLVVSFLPYHSDSAAVTARSRDRLGL